MSQVCQNHVNGCLFLRKTQSVSGRGAEREREREREIERERETQNWKQAPGSKLSAQSPTRGWNS